jgi:ATP-dependent DNA ligase
MSLMYDILEEVANTSSRKEKIAILTAHKNNALLQKVFHYALNPFEVFGVKKIPQYDTVLDIFEGDELTIEYLDAVVVPLKNRVVTGHAAIDHLQRALASLTLKDASVLSRVIGKDLRCGVAAKTANAVFGKGFIPEYPVMLAASIDEDTQDGLVFPMFAQTKSDGMRFNTIVENGTVKYFSRAGQEIELFSFLDAEFLALSGVGDYVFDGELLVLDSEGVVLPRAKGNGILNKAIKGTITEKEADRVRACVWDMIHASDFYKERSDKPYHERLRTLNLMVEDCTTERVTVAKTWTVQSFSEADNLFRDHLARGEEGIILKTVEGPWEAKRSKFMLKMKDIRENEFKCVGWVEGTGKYVGKLGAIVVESRDGTVKTDVGTGFSDADRESIKPDDIVGSIVTIAYNAIIENEKTPNIHSLFLPRFAGIRLDKSEADLL